MAILFAIGILFLVVVALLAFVFLERKEHSKLVAELTSKIMSNSFAEFSYHSQRAVNKRNTVEPNKVTAKKPVADPVLGSTY